MVFKQLTLQNKKATLPQNRNDGLYSRKSTILLLTRFWTELELYHKDFLRDWRVGKSNKTILSSRQACFLRNIILEGTCSLFNPPKSEHITKHPWLSAYRWLCHNMSVKSVDINSRLPCLPPAHISYYCLLLFSETAMLLLSSNTQKMQCKQLKVHF